MNVEEVVDADKQTDLDSDDNEASVFGFSIDGSDAEPHVTVSSAPPQVTLAAIQQPSELT